MGAVRTAVGAVARDEALLGQERVETPRDPLHRGVAGGQVLLSKTALVVAAHPRPQEEIGRIEIAGSGRPGVQGQVGVDEQLKTVVESIGLFHQVGQANPSGDLLLLLVFQVGDEQLFFPALQAVDPPLEAIAAAAEGGGEFDLGGRHLVGKEERTARLLLPFGDVGQMALDDGLADGLVGEFRAQFPVALPPFFKALAPPLDGGGAFLELPKEAVEEIPDEEVGVLLLFEAGGRREVLDLFEDETVRAGEEAFQRTEGPGALAKLRPDLVGVLQDGACRSAPGRAPGQSAASGPSDRIRFAGTRSGATAPAPSA